MMHMDMGFDYELSATMRVSPTRIAFATVLALPATQLEQIIRAELESNPALDMVERETCPVCGQTLIEGLCYACLERETQSADLSSTNASTDEDEFDPLSLVATPRSLPEHLWLELAPMLQPEERFIGEFLIGCLDARGFLDGSVAEIASSLGVKEARVQSVVDQLRQSGPPGIGARDVRECLLLQLARLEEAGEAPALARSLLEEHFEELAKGHYARIAQALNARTEDVVKVRDFIRQHLRPYPVPDPDEDSANQPTDTLWITPDVIVRERADSEEQFEIAVVESQRYAVRLNPLYRRLAQELSSNEVQYSNEEAEHIREHLRRARQFMGHLRERRRTLLMVAQYVLSRQKEFLRHGVRHLTPLAQAEVAVALGLHESTISRATAGKYVQLPDRTVISFKSFFKAQLSIHDMIRELIANEERDHPLSDSEIARILKEQGHPLARRTVTKYRNEMGLLPSNLR